MALSRAKSQEVINSLSYIFRYLLKINNLERYQEFEQAIIQVFEDLKIKHFDELEIEKRNKTNIDDYLYSPIDSNPVNGTKDGYLDLTAAKRFDLIDMGKNYKINFFSLYCW